MTAPSYDPTNYGNAPGAGPLRIGGVESTGLPSQDDANLPSTRSHEAKEQENALTIMGDLFEGPEAVRKARTAYLPMDPGEQVDEYNGRLQRSVFFNAVRQTVNGIVGFILRADPKLGEDVPKDIQADWENIDGAGTHGAVFTRTIAQMAVRDGHAAILVEFPKTGGTQSFADEKRGVRPYWVPIEKEAICSWRTVVEGGRTLLAQIVIEECQYRPTGAFGEEEQTQYRVLRRQIVNNRPVVTFEVLVVTKSKQVVSVDFGVYQNQTEIPIVEVPTSGREGLFESEPPLLDLAYLNIAHYQQRSDYANSLHKTCVPILTVIGAAMPARGESEQKMVIGPNTGLSLPKDGDAKYVAHDGAALGACRTALEDLKAEMAALGLQMLAPSKRVAETADAKRIDKAATDSDIAVTARGLQDALENALQFHANYLRQPDGGSVTINREYEDIRLSAQDITALSGLVKDDQLSLETLWTMLTDGNVLPEDFDADSERALLEAAQTIRAATVPPSTPSVVVNNGQPAPTAGVDMQYDETGKLIRMVRTNAA